MKAATLQLETARDKAGAIIRVRFPGYLRTRIKRHRFLRKVEVLWHDGR